MTTTARLRLVVACNAYPFAEEPQHGTFVRALVDEWARRDVEPTVVAPRSVWDPRAPALERQDVDGGARVTVLRPRYLSFSNRRLPFGRSTFPWSVASYSWTFARAAMRLVPRPDAVYAHFLFPPGFAALRFARQAEISAAVALGESSLAYYEPLLGQTRIADALRSFDAIVSVSEENKAYCVEHLGIGPDRIEVVPNATDPRRFRPRPRSEARRLLGLPRDVPIVGFTGHFIERKGPLRVLKALESVPDSRCFFLGSGTQVPTGPRVLRASPVPNVDVPIWLSAADVFVLPTLAEGCPNAVIEAMACGIPIVSSDIASVRETVGEGPAVLVDPRDTAAIGEALARVLADAELRTRMSEAGLARAARFTLEARGERILGSLERAMAVRRTGL